MQSSILFFLIFTACRAPSLFVSYPRKETQKSITIRKLLVPSHLSLEIEMLVKLNMKERSSSKKRRRRNPINHEDANHIIFIVSNSERERERERERELLLEFQINRSRGCRIFCNSPKSCLR
jgi:hypothetical protein